MIQVMIVEDDPMVAQLNKRYIEQMDDFMPSHLAKSAKEALATLASTNIDLVLLDVYMPGDDGIKFLKLVREQNRDVDVILVTAASEITHIQQALRLGAIDYLIKPFEFDRFQEALLNYKRNYYKLNHKEQMNQKELDHMLRSTHPVPNEVQLPSEDHSLPKGLTKNTLETIYTTILSLKTTPFSTDEIATTTNISRVSVRKYLKFLSSIGYLKETLTYGVGRPIYQYAINPDKQSTIQHYL
ncbi:response regulator [Guptibacillus hwajinpoensis]|uniref:response regulator n=1 Tax=Guptibacillus hwajinpoensis TaxID=208199 RepID=UPI001CFF50EF|nr:response regulator [Pseudalkalibacillus hwajinpoensis]